MVCCKVSQLCITPIRITFSTLPVTVATLDTAVSYIGFTQHAMINTFNVRETSLTMVPC